MKKINLASLLGVILLIISFFTPIAASSIKLNTEIIYRIVNTYLIAYIAYMISFMDTGRVGLLFLPLIFHLLINFFLIKGFNIKLNREVLDDFYQILRRLYDLISLVGIFFLVEFLINRIFGSTFSSTLGVISLALFYYYDYSKILIGFPNFKDIFLYFAVFVMGLRIRRADKINPLLYILSLGILALEIFFSSRYKLNYGYFLSFVLIIYLMLKGFGEASEASFEKFMIFVYIYMYPTIFVGLRIILGENILVTSLLSTLVSLFIGQILFRFNIRPINILLVGI
ncbi:hypothetical protein [Anaerococcus marasmi]|uniref:hypothetical protein n=1 Tax=Anaerococcus marasmi TaxID=2057797 RepID=UPI000CF8D97A|nr:hypothetical protein [Anaerococcus marasmi]